MRRRRSASGAVAPAAIFVCALAGGDALAAPAPGGPGSPARKAPSTLMLVGASASMQARASRSSPPPFVRPRLMAVRIDTAEAPTIDADLSDPAWAKAAVIDNFTQRSPNPYEPATERTVVRILYDENNLYFSFYNYDSTPEAIIVRNMQRDGQLYTSDSVMIYLDPGQTRRNAYNFEIGASGGRSDQLELNNTEELTEWDTIWEARARIVQDGWVAEFAIPFKSLSYEANQTTWGFDVARRIFHKNERVHWSGFNPAVDFTDVSQTGDLVGIENVGEASRQLMPPGPGTRLVAAADTINRADRSGRGSDPLLRSRARVICHPRSTLALRVARTGHNNDRGGRRLWIRSDASY